MSAGRRPRFRFTAAAVLSAVILTIATPAALGAPTGTDVRDARLQRIARTIDEIQRSTVPREGGLGDRPPAESPPDPSAPGVVLPAVLDELQALDADPAARRAVEKAFHLYSSGSPRPDLGYLAGTGRALQDAAQAVSREAGASDGERARRLALLVDRLTVTTRRILTDILDRATHARVDGDVLIRIEAALAEGDRRLTGGDDVGATSAYGQGLAIMAKPGTLVFDIDRFEKNIRSALIDESVGYAYTITRPGKPDRANSGGFARTSADLPEVNQAPSKRMHVASVSKPITAVAVLRLLEARGLSPDDPVAPWLPPTWGQGSGIGGLTFRQLLIHRSGLAVSEPGPDRPSDYASLRQNIIAGVLRPCAPQPCDPAFNYENANFGLMRVIVPYLLGIDPAVVFPDDDPAVATAAIYLDYVRNDILAPAGITGTGCAPTDSLQTLLYRFPYDGSDGAATGDYTLECGGFGFYLSTNEMARFITTLRYTNALLSIESRKVMNRGFLGWMDPANGYPWGDGKFGVYLNHAGDWSFGDPPPARGSHSCVLNFSISVQAALHINSDGGNDPSACEVLREEFENAWVAG